MAPALAVVALALSVAAVVLTPPGEAVGRWVRDLVGLSPAPAPRPALTSLPAAGRLLVSGPGGTWVVQADGSRRRLGPYRDPAWSPRGLFVAATRGRELLAVEPGGAVRWVLARPRPVRHPRWSPDGFRIAYLTGGALRVVAGDGSGDRPLRARAAAVAPAWRPGGRHHVAYVHPGGGVRLVDADSGATLWRARPGALPARLEWSRDGRRLVVLEPRAVRILDARGRERRRLAPAAAAALSPSGGRLAVVRSQHGSARSTVLVQGVTGRRRSARIVFAAGGRLADVAWSPDGRWLLASWVSADQWLFLRAGGRGGVRAVSQIARQFDPRPPRARAMPAIGGWCCAQP